MNKILVFYAGMLYGEYTKVAFRELQVQGPLELYNGAYVFQQTKIPPGWCRMDQTPVLLCDVPKVYQTIKLLLT